MRVFVGGITWATLTRTANQGASYGRTLARLGIRFLNRTNNERLDRSARILCLAPQSVVQRFRYIDRGADSHDMIMAQVTWKPFPFTYSVGRGGLLGDQTRAGVTFTGLR